jgi:hypothetical protein
MRIHQILALVAVVFLWAGTAAAADVVVGLHEDGGGRTLLEAEGAGIVAAVPELELYLVRLPEGGEEAGEDLQGLRGVRFVEENVPHKLPDGLQSSIWFLERRLDPTEQTGVVLPPVYLSRTGVRYAPVINVAYLDGAVDAGHPDLAGIWDGGRDFVEDDGDPRIPEEILASPRAMSLTGNLHATAVGGLLAGAGERVRLRLYRVLDQYCEGTSFNVARGIVSAVGDGADLILLPLGSRTPSAAVNDAVAYAAERDVLVVAAAGNDGTSRISYPASDQDTLAVAAVNDDGSAADFTSYGSHVDLSDRGVLLEAAYPGNAVGLVSGTSFSAARTAAAAAALRRELPQASADEIRILLMETAAPLSEENRRLARGLGEGITDLDAALTAAGLQ